MALNRAHFLHRQAEKATKKGRVEEAIRYHKEAADILNELLQNILDEKVAESLRLQAQLHEKERVILRHQRKKAEKVYRDLESLRKMAGKSNNLPGDGDSLQLSIYRKFEETECLLDQLKIQEDSPSMSSEQQTPVRNVERSFSAEPTNGNIRLPSDTRDMSTFAASKKPKDEAVIIEELQVANSHLRKMVDSLFYELSSCQRENLELKARVRYLENLHGGKCHVAVQPQPTRPPLVQSQSAQASPSHGFKTFKPELATPVRVPTQTARLGAPPPPQFASMRDDDSSIQSSSTIAEECDLPALPPLEMPSFDFTLKTSSATTNPPTSSNSS